MYVLSSSSRILWARMFQYIVLEEALIVFDVRFFWRMIYST